ncbi:hypothetical protein E2C01_038177 [Portunus trituberculatus]|uniref:Uncharacterized protein n=1 Tax=Portunus trituberculatus TaxID=210409 RepID=A0A5B7FJ91_PORTR|nr:hypothetical protein [Portunus trituberculatus]
MRVGEGRTPDRGPTRSGPRLYHTETSRGVTGAVTAAPRHNVGRNATLSGIERQQHKTSARYIVLGCRPHYQVYTLSRLPNPPLPTPPTPPPLLLIYPKPRMSFCPQLLLPVPSYSNEVKLMTAAYTYASLFNILLNPLVDLLQQLRRELELLQLPPVFGKG